MSIPPLAELLRKPYPPEKPTPTEIFAPFLMPGEEMLWVGQPNAECHTRQYLRAANIAFGGGAVFAALPAITYYCVNISNGMSIILLCFSPLLLFCLLVEHSHKHSPPKCYFAVTNVRVLSYDSHTDGPPLLELPLCELSQVSIKLDRNTCGTIYFNPVKPWLLKVQKPAPFSCVEDAEDVAALILDAKQKSPSVSTVPVVALTGPARTERRRVNKGKPRGRH